MSREYNFGTSGTVSLVNAAVTLLWLSPPSNASVEILRIWAGQTGTDTSDQIHIQFVTQVSSFPTLVSPFIRKLKSQDPSSLLSGLVSGISGAGIAATGEGTGAKTVLYDNAFNNLNGFEWIGTPDDRYVMAAATSQGFGVHLPSAVATLSGWVFGMTYREI